MLARAALGFCVRLGRSIDREPLTMNADNLLDRIPQWLKSLYEMENELRNAARKGFVLRRDEAAEHLAQARRHLESALNEATGVEPPNGPQTPLRKEGEF
jgi:hypothetical protein